MGFFDPPDWNRDGKRDFKDAIIESDMARFARLAREKAEEERKATENTDNSAGYVTFSYE